MSYFFKQFELAPLTWLATFAPLLIVVALWTVVWKGLALWHAARRGEPRWFVALAVINTVGILEIIYLFGVAKIPANKLFSMSK